MGTSDVGQVQVLGDLGGAGTLQPEEERAALVGGKPRIEHPGENSPDLDPGLHRGRVATGIARDWTATARVAIDLIQGDPLEFDQLASPRGALALDLWLSPQMIDMGVTHDGGEPGIEAGRGISVPGGDVAPKSGEVMLAQPADREERDVVLGIAPVPSPMTEATPATDRQRRGIDRGEEPGPGRLVAAEHTLEQCVERLESIG